MTRNKTRKVVKMKKRTRVGTGLLLLLFSIYILFMFIQSLTKEHISIYEVTEKQIADDNTVRGVILRQEELVTTDSAGYINYFVGEGTRVGIRTNVYSVDQTGEISSQLNLAETGDINLSAQDTDDIRGEIASFRDSFDSSHFYEAYNFKYNLDNKILELNNANLANQLAEILQNGVSSGFNLMKAKKNGIISYTSDGLENLNAGNLTAKNFENMNDDLTPLRQSEAVDAGKPVYKLITSENWSIVIPLSKIQFQNIQQQQNVTIILKKVNAKVKPAVTTFTMDGGYYAKLELKHYMIQYLNNRYVDVEIQINDASGLKIPNSSITKKRFYEIPKKYIVKSEQQEEGVRKIVYQKNGDTKWPFVATDVLYLEEDSDTCFIDASDLDAGTQIVDSQYQNPLQLKATRELEGVYCCNKGYCEFKRIEQIYKNAEYTIISKKTDHGLSTYDHIILNPELIDEDDIIY